MNKVSVCGVVTYDAHPYWGIPNTFITQVSVPRLLSTYEDRIPVVFSDKMLDCFTKGVKRHVLGRVQTQYDKEGHKFVYVYANQVFSGELTFGENNVRLSGYVLNKRNVFSTVRNSRNMTVTEMVCKYGTESAFIPLVLWDKDKSFVEGLNPNKEYIIDGEFCTRVNKSLHRKLQEVEVKNLREGKHEKYQVKENRDGELQGGIFSNC